MSGDMTRHAIVLAAAIFAAGAHGAELGVSNAWIRLLPAGVPAGGYFTVHNAASTPAQLVGASSAVFGQSMMHESIEERGRSRMVHVEKVAVPAGSTLEFAPGGYHLMLMQPTRALAVGETVPVTLEFSSGERITTRFVVRGPAGK